MYFSVMLCRFVIVCCDKSFVEKLLALLVSVPVIVNIVSIVIIVSSV